MKLKLLILSGLVLTITACGGGGSNPNSGNSSATNPGGNQTETAYIAFSSAAGDGAKRLDTLYKTDGTAANTQEISNSFVPANPEDYGHESLLNFNIFGNYLYLDRELSSNNCLISSLCGKLQKYQMELSTDTITTLTGVTGASLFNLGGLAQIEANNQVYVLYEDDSTANQAVDARIKKYSAQGAESNVSIPNNLVAVVTAGMVSISDKVYFGGGASLYGVLEMDTSNSDAITGISGLPSDFVAHRLLVVGTDLYIYGSDSSGRGMWKYTGSGNATQVTGFPAALNIQSALVHGSNIYFVARNGTDNDAYVLDTTTNAVTQITSLAITRYNFKFVEYNSEIYFLLDTKFFKANGSNPATEVNATATAGIYYTEAVGMAVAAGKIFFSAATNAEGYELWSYDGTTVTMEDLNSGAGSSFPRHFTEVNGEMVFQASTDGVSNKLYQYGTPLTPLF